MCPASLPSSTRSGTTRRLVCEEFYGALFKGWDKGRVEMAVSQARSCLSCRTFPGDRVIGTPVLFSRAVDGLLFDLRTGDALKDLPVTQAQRDTTKAAIRTREANEEILKNDPEQTEEVAAGSAGKRRSSANLRLRLRLGKASVVAAFLLAPLLFGLLWLGVFDNLPRGLKIQSYTVWLVDNFFPKSFTDRIALVPITDRTADRLHPPRENEVVNWRGEHAKLVERLSRADAKVISFDMYFPRSKGFDDEFSRAILAARQRGTSVIVGVKEAPERVPEITPVLRDAVSDWVCCASVKLRIRRTLCPCLSTGRNSRIESPSGRWPWHPWRASTAGRSPASTRPRRASSSRPERTHRNGSESRGRATPKGSEVLRTPRRR